MITLYFYVQEDIEEKSTSDQFPLVFFYFSNHVPFDTVYACIMSENDHDYSQAQSYKNCHLLLRIGLCFINALLVLQENECLIYLYTLLTNVCCNVFTCGSEHSQKDWLIPLFIIISDNFLFIFSQVQ